MSGEPGAIEPGEDLEWFSLLEEFALPLDTVGRRVRFWQHPPGALTSERAYLRAAGVVVVDRFSVPLPTVEQHLGPYRVAIYLVPADLLAGPNAPGLWALTQETNPSRYRWLRETVRHGDSPAALEVRWRVIGEEHLRLVGLTDATPKRLIDQAWAGLPVLRTYQGIGQAEEAFRRRLRVVLQTLAKKPSDFERGLSIVRLAKEFGLDRAHFYDRLKTYGIDPQALRSWRPGDPLPV